MQLNEWGVKPGMQDNLLPEDAPMLSESECILVTLYRAFPANRQRMIIKMLTGAVFKISEK